MEKNNNAMVMFFFIMVIYNLTQLLSNCLSEDSLPAIRYFDLINKLDSANFSLTTLNGRAPLE